MKLVKEKILIIVCLIITSVSLISCEVKRQNAPTKELITESLLFTTDMNRLFTNITSAKVDTNLEITINSNTDTFNIMSNDSNKDSLSFYTKNEILTYTFNETTAKLIGKDYYSEGDENACVEIDNEVENYYKFDRENYIVQRFYHEKVFDTWHTYEESYNGFESILKLDINNYFEDIEIIEDSEVKKVINCKMDVSKLTKTIFKNKILYDRIITISNIEINQLQSLITNKLSVTITLIKNGDATEIKLETDLEKYIAEIIQKSGKDKELTVSNAIFTVVITDISKPLDIVIPD